MNAAVDRAGVSPAHILFDDDGVPHAPDFGDVYHSRAGAALQAQAVFLAGNGLPQRWMAPPSASPAAPFTVLETGLGLGHNFLTTLQAWLNLPERHVQRLLYVAVEQFPPSPEALSQAHRTPNEAQRQRLAHELLAQWPPCMTGSHTLTFDEGRVTLRLWLGDASRILPRLQVQADAVYLDGFAPSHNPTLWSPQLLRQVARLSRPGATLATWSTAGAVRLALTQAGYVCHKRPGFGGKRERLEAHYQPRWHPPAPAAFAPAPARNRGPQPPHAVIVGGGLAGASAAHALAQRGWRCTVLDAADAPASGASGNPAGLLHGIVHLEDGTHARWLRTAALYAYGQLAPLLQQHRIPGQLDGYVRRLEADAPSPALEALDVDTRYARPLTRHALSAALGWTPVAQGGDGVGGLLFPQGGWVSPAALVRWWLHTPGIDWRGAARVDRLLPCPNADTTRWLALDDQGQALADPADALVVATANAALPLLQRSLSLGENPAPLWWLPPLRAQRGQISLINRADWPDNAGADALGAPPLRPVSRYAYALSTGPESAAGQVVFGATHQWDDADPSVRSSDHHENLRRLMAVLAPQDTAQPDEAAQARCLQTLQALPWQGRTGWRCMSPDRLPLLGRVPHTSPPDTKAAQRPYANQHLARVDGLYLCTALGSRGLTLAPLLGEALACLISGEALPVDTRLMDALEPARFALKPLSQS